MVVAPMLLKKRYGDQLCRRCLARYRGFGRLAALYVVKGAGEGALHLVQTLFYVQRDTPLPDIARARAAPHALCGWRVPGAWHGHYVAVSRLLDRESAVRYLLVQHPGLENRPLSLGLLRREGVDLEGEMLLAALGEL